MRLRFLLIMIFLVLTSPTSMAEQEEVYLSVKLSLEPPFSLEFSQPVQLFTSDEQRLEKSLISKAEWKPVKKGSLDQELNGGLILPGKRFLLLQG